MATRKGKPAGAPAAKAASRQKMAADPATPRATSATTSAAGGQRLLREAAWSRMFGRTEARNPFGRAR